jgi:3-deoxy-D-manno-octulosonate 8-phosphate phosphatase (KDO 8-P phosphatase)
MYKRFIMDVDGVLNDGMLYWGADGKPFKAFGNYDHDGLKLLRSHIEIEFVSADENGWPITYNRIVEHMKFPLTMVKEKDRLNFVLSKGDPKETIFMGDGPYDAKIMPYVGLSFAPAQAWRTAISNATVVTRREGGKGAVMDACVYIMDKMGIEHGF